MRMSSGRFLSSSVRNDSADAPGPSGLGIYQITTLVGTRVFNQCASGNHSLSRTTCHRLSRAEPTSTSDASKHARTELAACRDTSKLPEDSKALLRLVYVTVRA